MEERDDATTGAGVRIPPGVIAVQVTIEPGVNGHADNLRVRFIRKLDEIGAEYGAVVYTPEYIAKGP